MTSTQVCGAQSSHGLQSGGESDETFPQEVANVPYR